MRINQNISAMNTYSKLTSANTAKSKSLEKLSSGLRINRAGDDAAGLAISEKMRGQISGLNQGVSNAQDAISLIQTAEGALSETHSILQRMRELSVQSATDTNSADDRVEIQKEVDQLSQELSRIGDTTEFNTQKLLNGTLESTFQIGANSNQNLKLEVGDMRAHKLGVAGTIKFKEGATASVAGTGKLSDGKYTVKGTDLLDTEGNVVASTTAEGKVWTSKSGDATYTFTEAVRSGTIDVATNVATATLEVPNTQQYGLQAGNYTVNATSIEDSDGNVIASSTDGLTYTNQANEKVAVFTSEITTSTDLSVGGLAISSRDAANNAIDTIDAAIQSVSSERSKLGATQNRLDHTINNLTTTSENLVAAESRIRDVDMAQEMMEFTKNNILSQAATSMLAQANQMPQSVLQLLQ